MAQSKGIWIDDEILGDEELNPSEKIVLALLTNLCRKDGNCTATNKYISECTHYNERKIFRMLSSLEIHGYIIIEKKQSTYRSIRISTLPNMAEPECQNWQSDSAKYGSPTLPLSQVSSYYKEKKNNIKDDVKGKYRAEPPVSVAQKATSPPTLEEVERYAKETDSAVNARRFYDYHVQRDWKGITDWKSRFDAWGQNEIGKAEKAKSETKCAEKPIIDLDLFDEVEAAMGRKE